MKITFYLMTINNNKPTALVVGIIFIILMFRILPQTFMLIVTVKKCNIFDIFMFAY